MFTFSLVSSYLLQEVFETAVDLGQLLADEPESRKKHHDAFAKSFGDARCNMQGFLV